jgi:hypothetical protein
MLFSIAQSDESQKLIVDSVPLNIVQLETRQLNEEEKRIPCQ